MGDTPWDVVYFEPFEPADSPIRFLDSCPMNVQAQMAAVLDAVAAAPPPQFSGGGHRGAMHREMTGFFEARKQGPRREQFRLFCVLENPATAEELERMGLSRPAIVVPTGMRKPWRTAFGEGEYEHVRELGADYRSTFPRRIVI